MGLDEGDRNFGCEVPLESQAYWWHNRWVGYAPDSSRGGVHCAVMCPDRLPLPLKMTQQTRSSFLHPPPPGPLAPWHMYHFQVCAP